jgi:hypothetical protein
MDGSIKSDTSTVSQTATELTQSEFDFGKSVWLLFSVSVEPFRFNAEVVSAKGVVTQLAAGSGGQGSPTLWPDVETAASLLGRMIHKI